MPNLWRSVTMASSFRRIKPPVRGLLVASMAQVYPEDRGTNYAIRDGRAAARMCLYQLGFVDKRHPEFC